MVGPPGGHAAEWADRTIYIVTLFPKSFATLPSIHSDRLHPKQTPWRSAATRCVFSPGSLGLSTPTTGICCAPAVNGHATAAPSRATKLPPLHSITTSKLTRHEELYHTQPNAALQRALAAEVLLRVTTVLRVRPTQRQLIPRFRTKSLQRESRQFRARSGK